MRKNLSGILALVYSGLMTAVLFGSTLLSGAWLVLAVVAQILITAGFAGYVYKKVVCCKEES